MSQEKKADKLVENFIPEHERLLRETNPWTRRFAVWLLLLAVACTGVWLSIAKVDTQVIARGIVETAQPRSTIHAFNSGYVVDLRVNIGDVVKKGETLITVRNESSEVDIQKLEHDLLKVEAEILRLEAEIFGETPARFSHNHDVHQLENSAYLANMQLHEVSLSRLLEQAEELASQIAEKERELPVLQEHYELMDQLANVREDLFKKEQERFQRDGPKRLEYLEAAAVSVSSQRVLISARHEISSLRRRNEQIQTAINAYLIERESSLRQQMVEAHRKYDDLRNHHRKAVQSNEFIYLKAPFEGVVVSRTNKAEGTLVQAGESLLELIPANSELRAVFDVSLPDIARVDPGAAVILKLDALPFTKHGVMHGSVTLISPDVERESFTGAQEMVFRSWAKIEDIQLREMPPGFVLQPGMTLEANIKTDERTILSFLTYPILRTLSQSFIEP
ncbi:Hemolysin secretion protein D, chromosomal [Falsiruegeria litorea R37]|uniref:Membrane fusion protein (MFP) family protein n=1 Tax=Falsiruegeria litorea R37 TaxID=1200284 RepID=A0A1Y5TUP9_9RHOB|nr:HlyD family type I secretion periplasmic adaptor subunit [Falsiruegeria litorea]SLN73397.1 Hemolysin secretion protein D, chromosomal [Falsiruegeria litorea R37]